MNVQIKLYLWFYWFLLKNVISFYRLENSNIKKYIFYLPPSHLWRRAVSLRKEQSLMHCTRKLNDTISWVGGNDRRLALFWKSVSHTAGCFLQLLPDHRWKRRLLIDTVDASISHQFLEKYLLCFWTDVPLDYLVINHMEPDHCANIEELLLRFPDLKIVGNAKTLAFAKQFYDMDMEERP